jgi:Ulp1 family protease
MNLKELNNQSVQHQRGGSECGMYVLFFIISMLEGKSPTYFNKRIIRDEEVFKFRKIYFNSED